MEIIIGIIVLLFVGAIIQGIYKSLFPKKCFICDFKIVKTFYTHSINGWNRTICPKCHRKIENKIHKRKFDDFFQEYEEETSSYKPPSRNRNITSQTKTAVWRRDEGRCVECGSNENLEYDHIIPVSKGGSNTMRNIQLLCERCNRRKSANIQ